ncbi:SDR family oxidoreductase [Pseudoalteromonas spongiae]|uniref:SDR family oxidoreductase n=1 Tax=Pseudoalteromonas spongiae TaxID=298657 RepID=UPI00110B3DC0|nr:SDR family oxidoreductase [Pseudoalteromonas spongiae]TMO83723.1 short-chain dehydrogenase [Pseudoalteromonas spongiae]
MKNIVILGATSAIAEEVAKVYASQGANLRLFARSLEKLAPIDKDLRVRGASKVKTFSFDADSLVDHSSLIDNIFSDLGRVDVLLIAYGSLPDQAKCENDVELTLQELTTNGVSVISLLTLAAQRFELQGGGSIAVISSVAGDRGRQSNYVYGAAKGLVSIFLDGLAQRLAKKGVHVLDVKPGFVDTPMTASFEKGALWAKPEKVANLITKRIDSRSTFSYTPSFWFLIMTVIKLIPKFIFNKIRL